MTSQAQNMVKQKRVRGNFMAMSCMTMAFVTLMTIFGYSFCGLYFIRERLQILTDELALKGCLKLNADDRIGRVNNKIARSRQLVFTSRQQYNQAANELTELAPLAAQLLNESRDSAESLAKEQKSIFLASTVEADRKMTDELASLVENFQVTLPWLKLSDLQIVSTKYGSPSAYQSNVEEITGSPVLTESDESSGYVQAAAIKPKDTPNETEHAGLNLYKAETNLKLPGADHDLAFELSALPAPVRDIIAPARVALPAAFKISTSKTCPPSALNVTISLSVQTALGATIGSTLTASGVAITNGASPAPENVVINQIAE